MLAVALVAIVAGSAGALMLTNGFGVKSSILGGLSDVGKGVGYIQSQTSEVQIGQVALIANTFDGSQALAPSCGGNSMNSYISLTNSGSSAAAVSSVTITYGGANNVFDVQGGCSIGPTGSPTATVYVLFPGPSELPNSQAPVPSEPFQGTVTLAGGVQLQFTGDFEQGYPTVYVSNAVVMAAQLAKGKANTTCLSSPPTSTSYVELSNNGTLGATVSQIGLAWNGTSATLPIAGTCQIGPDGTPSASVYVSLPGIGPSTTEPTAGESYTVTAVILAGAMQGMDARYTGQFQ